MAEPGPSIDEIKRARILKVLNEFLMGAEERPELSEDSKRILAIINEIYETNKASAEEITDPTARAAARAQADKTHIDLLNQYGLSPPIEPRGEPFLANVVDDLISEIGNKVRSRLDHITPSAAQYIYNQILTHLFATGVARPEYGSDPRRTIEAELDPYGVNSILGQVIEDTERLVEQFPRHPTKALRFGRILQEMYDSGRITKRQYDAVYHSERFEDDNEFLDSVTSWMANTLYPLVDEITDEVKGESGDFITALETHLKKETVEVENERGYTLYPSLGDEFARQRRTERIAEERQSNLDRALTNPKEILAEQLARVGEGPTGRTGIYREDLTKEGKRVYDELERELEKQIKLLELSGVEGQEEQALSIIREFASQALGQIRQAVEDTEMQKALQESEAAFNKKYETETKRKTSLFDNLLDTGLISPESNPYWIDYVKNTIIPSIDLDVHKIIRDGIIKTEQDLTSILPNLVAPYGNEENFLTSSAYFQRRHDIEGEGLPPTAPADFPPGISALPGFDRFIEPEPTPSKDQLALDLTTMFDLPQDEEFLDFLIRNIDEIQKGFGQEQMNFMMQGIPSEREKLIYEEMLLPQAMERRMQEIEGLTSYPILGAGPPLRREQVAPDLFPYPVPGLPILPDPIDYGELGRQARRAAQVKPPDFTEYFKGPVFEKYAEEFRTSPMEQFRREKTAELEEERADIERQAESERMAAQAQREQESQRRRLLRGGRTVIAG